MEFPYEAYKLTNTFLIKKVMVVAKGRWRSEEWVELKTGGTIHQNDLHATVADAIKAGSKAIAKQRANIEKLTKNVELREKNLNRAKA